MLDYIKIIMIPCICQHVYLAFSKHFRCRSTTMKKPHKLFPPRMIPISLHFLLSHLSKFVSKYISVSNVNRLYRKVINN